MIINDGQVEVESPDSFWLDLHGGEERMVWMNRAELSQLRVDIDQALNTSAQELELPSVRQTFDGSEPFTPLRDPRIDFR